MGAVLVGNAKPSVMPAGDSVLVEAAHRLPHVSRREAGEELDADNRAERLARSQAL